MAPRGRGRPPKPRTTRMDAAIDAMKPYGFAEKVVRAKMSQLLKEYEGEYLFIESDAYKVLLDSIIEDQDVGDHHQQNLLEAAPGETSNSNVMVEDKEVKEDHAIVPADGFIDIPICTSTPHVALPPPPPLPPLPLGPPPSPPPPPPPSPPPVLDALPPPPPILDAFPPPPPPVLDVLRLPPPPPLPVLDALPPPETVQPRRRKPCNGWFCVDENLQFIILPPSINGEISPPTQPETPHQQAHMEWTSGRKNRQSRWDVKPEDM